jgi:ABC-type multidrug transport system ATPase subunit
MSHPPLLAARDLRVDIDGAVALENVGFETRGRSVAVVGDARGLFLAIAGAAPIRAGSLAVSGLDVARREQIGPSSVGMAPLDPPLAPKWTATEYLVWSARLAGMSRATASESASSTLAELGLERLAKSKVPSVTQAERRAIVLAAAVVARPAVLLAEAPLAGLSGEHAAYVSAVLRSSCEGRKWILSLSNLHAGSDEHVLAAQADDLLVFASGKLVRQGKLAKIEDGTVGYSLMVRSRGAEFREALRARGIEMTGGPQRFFVELPSGTRAQDLVALSAEVGAPLVELVPRILLS